MYQSEQSLYESMDMPDYNFPIKLLDNRIMPGAALHLHWHPHIEIHYVIEGSFPICCDLKPYMAKTNDIIIVNSNELHSSMKLDEPVRYYTLIFDPTLLFGKHTDPCLVKYLHPICHNNLYFEHIIKHPSRLHGCVKAIIKEYQEKATGYELEIKSLLYHLIALLYRYHQSGNSEDQVYIKRRKNLDRLSKVLVYVHEHLNEEITNQELADMMHITIYHFQRLFKETIGQTPTAYINRLKMDQAEGLLLNSHMSITEIADRFGYEASYFSRLYKQYKGFSPSESRKG